MNLKTCRTLLLISALLFSGAALLAFLAAPYIGSAYLMPLKGIGNQLPNLTAKVALPLLRTGFPEMGEPSVTQGWVAAVWLLLMIAPLGAAYWAWHGKSEDMVARWVLTMSIYLPLVASLAIIIVSGLAVSLTCL